MKRASILLTALLLCLSTSANQLERGEQFLVKLFNPELNLLPEYPGAKVYWLYHDNYLAAKILDKNHPALAKKIRTAIRGFGYTNSGKIEIVFNESPHALPFRHYVLTNVAATKGVTIRTEIVTTNVMNGWEQYADLVFLAAIAQARTNREEAAMNFEKGLRMWDGKGFKDPATEKLRRYGTYKLALALIAAERVGKNLPFQADAIDRLRDLQSKAGGWITDYLEDGTPVGFANVETTCLVMLALTSQK